MAATIIVCVFQSCFFFTWGKHCGETGPFGQALRYILIPAAVLAVLVWVLHGGGSLSTDYPSHDKIQAQRDFEALSEEEQRRRKLVAAGRVLVFGTVPGLIGLAVARRHQLS